KRVEFIGCQLVSDLAQRRQRLAGARGKAATQILVGQQPPDHQLNRLVRHQWSPWQSARQRERTRILRWPLANPQVACASASTCARIRTRSRPLRAKVFESRPDCAMDHRLPFTSDDWSRPWANAPALQRITRSQAPT